MNAAAHRSTEPIQPHILWGTPHSLYTGKARSCLIKKGLAFLERCPSHPDYKARVRPAVGLVTFPVLETPEGQFIQDSTDIVTYLDALDNGAPGKAMTPATPVQLAVARLIDGFGLEGMLQVAMHYRWSYRDEQELFLQTEFGRGLYAGADREARRAAGRRVMEFFSSMLPALGITPQTIPVIEAAYEELLEALDVHFQSYPYVLGWRVSVADLGLIAPLYAHLGRDPYPTALMKKRAPNVCSCRTRRMVNMHRMLPTGCLMTPFLPRWSRCWPCCSRTGDPSWSPTLSAISNGWTHILAWRRGTW
ncbi:MAG: glutathione S-transferase [Burkholderiales bacterium]|nr:glutathione S-transferase [Burkholderiales bacterium]